MAAGWGPVSSTEMPPLSPTIDPAYLLLSGFPKMKEAGFLAATVNANARYYTHLCVYAVQLLLVFTILSSEITKLKEVHFLKTKKRRKVVKDVTVSGGTMYHEENGVKLVVPEGAVPHNETYSITYNTVPQAEYDVPTGQHAVSPVPEFTAPGTFSKHVQVHLPLTSHTSDEQDINVYYRNNSGDQWTQVRQEAEHSDVCFEIIDGEVVVHTTHFTQFMCTCKGAKNRDLHLSAALFAYCPEEEKDRQEVQLTLYVVDKEFMPADFLKTLDAKEKGIMRRFEIHLPPLEGDRKYTPDDFLEVELYVESEWNILNIDQRNDEKLESKKLQQLVSCHGQWGKKQMAKYFIQRPVTEDRKKNIMVQMMLRIRRKASKGKKEDTLETVAEYTERIDLEQLFENMKLKAIAKSKPKKSTTSESGLETLNGQEALPESVHETHPERPAKIAKLDSWEDKAADAEEYENVPARHAQEAIPESEHDTHPERPAKLAKLDSWEDKAGDAEDYENVPARHEQSKGTEDVGYDEVDSTRKGKEGVTKDMSTGHCLPQVTPQKQVSVDDLPEDDSDLSLDDIVIQNQPRKKKKTKDSTKGKDTGLLVDLTSTSPAVKSDPVQTGTLIDLVDTSSVCPAPQLNQDALLIEIDTQNAPHTGPTSPDHKKNEQTAYLIDLQEEDGQTEIDMQSLRSQFENLSRDFSQKEEITPQKSAEGKETKISVPVAKKAADVVPNKERANRGQATAGEEPTARVYDKQKERSYQIQPEDDQTLTETRVQEREQEEDKPTEIDMQTLRSRFENLSHDSSQKGPKQPKSAERKENQISAPFYEKAADVVPNKEMARQSQPATDKEPTLQEHKLEDTNEAADVKKGQRVEDEECDDRDPVAERVREFKSLRYRFESKTRSSERPIYRSHGHFAEISGAPKRTHVKKPPDVTTESPGKTNNNGVWQEQVTGSEVPWRKPRKLKQQERRGGDTGRWRADPVKDTMRAGEADRTESPQTDKPVTKQERKEMDQWIKRIEDYAIKHNLKTDLGDLRYCRNVRELIEFYETIIRGQGHRQLIWQKKEDGSSSFIEVPVLETKGRLAQRAPIEQTQIKDDVQRGGNGSQNQVPEQRRKQGSGDLRRLQSEVRDDGVIIKLPELIDHYEQN